MKPNTHPQMYLLVLCLLITPLVVPGQQPRSLEPGKFVEETLAEGQTHSYQLALAIGQFAHLRVNQIGQNVQLKALSPTGETVALVDALPTSQGTEDVYLVAESAGAYRLEVLAQGGTPTGSYTISLESLREAQPLDQTRFTAQRHLTEIKAATNQGFTAYWRQVGPKYEEALKLWLQANELRQATLTLHELATLFPLLIDGLPSQFLNAVGARNKMIAALEQALTQWRAAGDRYGEAVTLNLLGLMHAAQGEAQKTVALYQESLRLCREGNHVVGEAMALHNLGIAYDLLGDRPQSLQHLNQALPLWEKVGREKGLAYTLNAIGDVYSGTYQLRSAITFYDRARMKMQALGDLGGEAYTLNNLAVNYLYLLEVQRALNLYGQALQIFQETGDRNGEALALHNSGGAFSILGDSNNALDFAQKALLLQQTFGNQLQVATALVAVGQFLPQLNQTAKALEALNQALAIGREQNAPETIRRALVVKSRIDIAQGNYSLARAQLEEVLSLTRQTKNQIGEAGALVGLGRVALALGDVQKASAYYRQAISLGIFLHETTSYEGLARVELSAGNLTEARKNIESAIATIESLRSKTAGPQMRAELMAAQRSAYEFQLNLLMQMHAKDSAAGHDRAALESHERASARTLLEQLAETRANIRQGVDAQLLNREADLRETLNAKAAEQAALAANKTATAQSEAVAKEIAALTAQYRELEAQIRAASPRYAALTQPQPLKADQIQQLLDADTLLLEYALGEERSWLFAVTPVGVSSFQLPPRKEIEPLANRLAKLLASPSITARSESELQRQAQTLSRILLGPVANQLGRKRLIIVATGALQYIPFASLPEPATGAAKPAPLLVAHEIVNLPSASTLAVLRREMAERKPPEKLVAVLADPVFNANDPRVRKNGTVASQSTNAGQPQQNAQRNNASTFLERSLRDFPDAARRADLARLFFSRDEAEAILAAAPVNNTFKAVDFTASRATAISDDLSQYRFVHFATHGLLNAEHPELSGLVFSLVDEKGQPQDGFLRLHEIYNLKLNADLVVLSACQTALGKEIKGEGLIGLTRGFMYAGAPRVVASLWKVDDLATAELMKRFYRAMLQGKQRPAAALRAAQLEMMQKQRWQPPFYWAAFTLQGEWK